ARLVSTADRPESHRFLVSGRPALRLQREGLRLPWIDPTEPRRTRGRALTSLSCHVPIGLGWKRASIIGSLRKPGPSLDSSPAVSPQRIADPVPERKSSCELL